MGFTLIAKLFPPNASYNNIAFQGWTLVGFTSSFVDEAKRISRRLTEGNIELKKKVKELELKLNALIK